MQGSIIDYFPSDVVGGSPRASQAEILFEIEAAVQEGITDIMVEAPTGTGKSAIGLCVQRWMHAERVHILTGTGMLQDQYLKEYPGAVTYKGSTYFNCCTHVDDDDGVSPVTCNIGAMMQSEPGEAKKYCKSSDRFSTKAASKNICPYVDQRNVAKVAPVIVFNYMSYLAAQRGMMFDQADLMILDEAHKAEGMLMEWVGVNLSIGWAKRLGLGGVVARARTGSILGAAKAIRSEAKALLDDEGTTSSTMSVRQAKRIEAWTNLVAKLSTVIAAPSRWIMQPHIDKEGIAFKPIIADDVAQAHLFKGKVNLIMSATLNKAVTCRSFGLDPNRVRFITVGSEFAVERRPVCGGFGFSYKWPMKSEILDLTVACIEDLLVRHAGQKGVVHSGTYLIHAHLETRLGSLGGRLIYLPRGDKEKRSRYLNKHFHSAEPTVLVSPALVEGIDLKDDLGRFQIVCKVPFLSLADKQVLARKDTDPDWYTYQAIASLVQASGRCVRGPNDYAVTYVLDNALKWLLRAKDTDWNPLAPAWFCEAVNYDSVGDELPEAMVG